MQWYSNHWVSGAHKRRKLTGCSFKRLPNPPKPKFKKNTFVDTTISDVLFDFPFRRIQPQNSADDQLPSYHTVPSNNAQKPCPPQQQDIIPFAVKISVLRFWRWAKVCPKHFDLILETNKTVIVASSWCSILLYLQWWCTVRHKSTLIIYSTLEFWKMNW
jgi:hypothetical protein